MNRIINININGIIFHVDESAYERLRSYLEALKMHFRNTEGKDEIMADIEARIAEMLQGNLKGSKEVVMPAEVEKIIAAMGHPEDFSEEESSHSKTGDTAYQSYERDGRDRPRRLYRDTDDKILGGVCSGMAAYFNSDPIWIRLIFVAAVLLGVGSGLLIYIILWIIIPPARTAAEKLEMQGFDVNISNLEKSFKGEMKNVKKKVDEMKEEAKRMASRENRDRIGGFFGEVVQVLGKVVGFFFVFIGLLLLLSLILSILAVLGAIPANIPFVVFDVMGGRQNLWFPSLGVFLLVGIPFLAFIYYGLRLLFKRGAGSNWVGASFFALWIAGVVISAIVGTSTASKFSSQYEVTETEDLPGPPHDTLYIGANEAGESNIIITTGRHHWHRHEKIMLGDDDTMNFCGVRFDIQKSPDKQFHLLMQKSAYGSNKAEARQMLSEINYSYEMKDSLLMLDRLFRLREGGKWRAQDMDLVLQVPSGKVIFLQNSLEEMLYDVDNIQNVYDDNMVGHKWIMTEDGLNCLDCPDEIIRPSHHHNSNFSVVLI